MTKDVVKRLTERAPACTIGAVLIILSIGLALYSVRPEIEKFLDHIEYKNKMSEERYTQTLNMVSKIQSHVVELNKELAVVSAEKNNIGRRVSQLEVSIAQLKAELDFCRDQLKKCEDRHKH